MSIKGYLLIIAILGTFLVWIYQVQSRLEAKQHTNILAAATGGKVRRDIARIETEMRTR